MIGDEANYSCPQCGTILSEPADPSTNLLECPDCGNQFFIKRKAPVGPVGGRSFVQHVHDLAAGRRAVIRQRSYFVMGGLGCFVFLGQMIYLLASYSWTTTGCAVLGGLAGVFAFGLVFFTRGAMRLTRLLGPPSR